MTDTESTMMMESMAAKASDLGLTAEEMGTEFNSAMGYLSSFGKEGIKAFERPGCSSRNDRTCNIKNA